MFFTFNRGIGLCCSADIVYGMIKLISCLPGLAHFFYSVFIYFAHFYFPASGQAVVTGVVPFPPLVLDFNFYRA